MKNDLTKKDIYGTPLTTILWFAVIFTAPLIMLYGLEKYALLDENHPVYLYLFFGSSIVAFILCIIFRQKLFPWGKKMPWLVWVGSVAISVVPAMFVLGGFLIINGSIEMPIIPVAP